MSASELHPPEPNPYSPPASEGNTPHAWGSEPVIESLRQTRLWVMFLSILGFLLTALVGCIALVEAALSPGQPTAYDAGRALGKAMGNGFFGVLCFFPSLYLWRFAGHIRDLIYTRRVADLESALRAQKSFWRFCGIVVALILALYALILLGAVSMRVFAMLGE